MGSMLRVGILVGAVLLPAASAGCGGQQAPPEKAKVVYDFKAKELSDLEVHVVVTHSFCIGSTYQYTLSYPVCIPPLPASCVDTYEVETQCIEGVLTVVRNDLVSSECDYDYSGTSCGPVELPDERDPLGGTEP